jgi:hypothetical protein
MGQGAKVARFPLSIRTCKHNKPKLTIANVLNLDTSLLYVIEFCEDCGSGRIAEYDRDPEGKPFNCVAALPWRSLMRERDAKA